MTSRLRLRPSPPTDTVEAVPPQGWQPLRPRTLVDAVIDEVIAAANEYGMVMGFTGVRLFHH